MTSQDFTILIERLSSKPNRRAYVDAIRALGGGNLALGVRRLYGATTR